MSSVGECCVCSSYHCHCLSNSPPPHQHTHTHKYIHTHAHPLFLCVFRMQQREPFCSICNITFRFSEHVLLTHQDCPDTLKNAADGNVIGLRKAVQYGADVNETLKVSFQYLFPCSFSILVFCLVVWAFVCFWSF